MTQRWNWLFPALVTAGVCLLTWAASQARLKDPPAALPVLQEGTDPTIQAVNAELERLWSDGAVEPAKPADELTVFRRLSLALHGTIPSLEEIRLFEADEAPQRLERWTEAMLQDDRFSSYWAERLARAYVGTENGQFILFRRDRFLDWLQSQLTERAPYDQMVRDMIGGNGVWTGEGEVNFLTAGFADGDFDPNKLAARTTRAFLGQRIDCAQCHDHPFDHWKQSEFEGLAAYYGQVNGSIGGIYDKKGRELKIEDPATGEERVAPPGVPFNPEWLGDGGSRREQLARWVTHPDNDRFALATANRMWALMFGRPFAVNRPVDDLPDPGTDESLRLLKILGDDLRAHNWDLTRTIRVLAASRAFRMDSRHEWDVQTGTDETGRTDDDTELRMERVRELWAVFPLVRLRPEQVVGSMLQAARVRTINQNSHLIVRFQRFIGERDFVEEFGDPGIDELQEYSGTIPQALLRMNGNLTRELSRPAPLNSPSGVTMAAPTPEAAIETAYLICLTRRPESAEVELFRPWFEPKKRRNRAVEDLYWTLFNAPEFSWNH